MPDQSFGRTATVDPFSSVSPPHRSSFDEVNTVGSRSVPRAERAPPELTFTAVFVANFR